MNKDKRALLLGLVLGDGHIRKYKDKRYKNAVTYTFKVKHSCQQGEYCEYKAKLVHSLLGGKKPKIVVSDNFRGHCSVSFCKTSKKLKSIYNLLYKDGKKVITRRVLDMLTPQAIAIWYMDDGSLTRKKRDGKVHAYDLYLCTYLSKEENQVIIDFFKEKYNISFTQTANRGKYRLRCGTKEARKFIEIVKPYIIPSMMYKITMDYDPT